MWQGLNELEKLSTGSTQLPDKLKDFLFLLAANENKIYLEKTAIPVTHIYFSLFSYKLFYYAANISASHTLTTGYSVYMENDRVEVWNDYDICISRELLQGNISVYPSGSRNWIIPVDVLFNNVRKN